MFQDLVIPEEDIYSLIARLDTVSYQYAYYITPWTEKIRFHGHATFDRIYNMGKVRTITLKHSKGDLWVLKSFSMYNQSETSKQPLYEKKQNNDFGGHF